MLLQDDLKALGRARWAVPVLAMLSEQDGARFAELFGALGISRDSLVNTLGHLIDAGWVARNSGHGHPLRPEYVLLPTGAPVAAACQRMMRTRRALGICQESLPRWSLPILGRLRSDRARFSELQHALAPVTPRALSLNLKQMIGGGIVDRVLEDGFPPSSLYSLAEPGRALLASLRSV